VQWLRSWCGVNVWTLLFSLTLQTKSESEINGGASQVVP